METIMGLEDPPARTYTARDSEGNSIGEYASQWMADDVEKETRRRERYEKSLEASPDYTSPSPSPKPESTFGVLGDFVKWIFS